MNTAEWQWQLDFYKAMGIFVSYIDGNPVGWTPLYEARENIFKNNTEHPKSDK